MSVGLGEAMAMNFKFVVINEQPTWILLPDPGLIVVLVIATDLEFCKKHGA